MRNSPALRRVVRACAAGAIALVVVLWARSARAQQSAAPLSAQRTVEISGLYFVESWDFNNRPRDFVQGASLDFVQPVHGGWSAVFEGLALHVSQRPPSAIVGGACALVRRRVARYRDTTFFLEVGGGVSYASVVVPERGTRFNYPLQAGAGARHALGNRAGAIVDLRFFHLSNNGLNGSNHNPDIEALGGRAGIYFAF